MDDIHAQQIRAHRLAMASRSQSGKRRRDDTPDDDLPLILLLIMLLSEDEKNRDLVFALLYIMM